MKPSLPLQEALDKIQALRSSSSPSRANTRAAWRASMFVRTAVPYYYFAMPTPSAYIDGGVRLVWPPEGETRTTVVLANDGRYLVEIQRRGTIHLTFGDPSRSYPIPSKTFETEIQYEFESTEAVSLFLSGLLDGPPLFDADGVLVEKIGIPPAASDTKEIADCDGAPFCYVLRQGGDEPVRFLQRLATAARLDV